VKAPKIRLPRQGIWGRIADVFMLPIMYLIQGTFFEKPQRTHRWNNAVLPACVSLQEKAKVRVSGDSDATRRWLFGFIPIFHIPILGGWREYVVLEPADSTTKYHIGYLYSENGKKHRRYSLVPVRGRVRMLRGPDDTCFFAVTRTGRQVPLRVVGFGRIGERGQYSHDTLL
jgi:hypothetical protein